MPIIAPNELPIDTYHSSAPAWLSKTSIRDYVEHGPAWWRMAYLTKEVQRPTPVGAEQGAALDCFLTEGPAVFESRYSIKPQGMSFATSEGKAWKASAVSAGKEFLSEADADILTDAVTAVRLLPQWPEIQAAKAQLTVRRFSQGLGLGLQSRPDWLDLERGILWDLKKTRDLDRFGKQAIDLGYHIQAAIAGWCLAGERYALNKAYLVAVEWERGARARVYEIPQEALTYADEQMRKAAAEIADRLKRDDWTDRQAEAEILPIPEFMMRKMTA